MTASTHKSLEKKPQDEVSSEVALEKSPVSASDIETVGEDMPEASSSKESSTEAVAVPSNINKAPRQEESLEPFEVSVKIPSNKQTTETETTAKPLAKDKTKKKPKSKKIEKADSKEKESDKKVFFEETAEENSPLEQQDNKKEDKEERSPQNKKPATEKKPEDTTFENSSSSHSTAKKTKKPKKHASKSSSSKRLNPQTINFGTTTIDLLRNGVIEDDSVFCGSTDDRLTDAGWQQMVSALENKNGWDLVVSSKLERCREFAELIATEEDIDIELDRKFDEIDFGEWEGLAPEKIMKEDAERLNAWWKSPTKCTPPEGEDFHLFQARVLSAFKNLLDDHCGKKILLVADAWTIRVIIMHVLGLQDEALFRLNVDYACYSQVEIHKDENGQQGCLIHHGY